MVYCFSLRYYCYHFELRDLIGSRYKIGMFGDRPIRCKQKTQTELSGIMSNESSCVDIQYVDVKSFLYTHEKVFRDLCMKIFLL